jgi:hypothetical protein
VPVGNESSNWMVTKRHQLAVRESRQAPATSQLHAEVRLLKLLTKHKAPLQMFPVIQEWARDCARLKHDFSRSIRPRAKVLSELEDRFDMQSSRFTPTIVSYLPDERPTVACVASFADAVCSLLSDPELMNEQNLSFPDPHDPFLFAEAPHPDGRTRRKPDLSELHHGSWHNDTQQARCTGPKDVLVPVIFYMDGVATDTFGRLGLTPLNFTLGVFNAETRVKKEAWVKNPRWVFGTTEISPAVVWNFAVCLSVLACGGIKIETLLLQWSSVWLVFVRAGVDCCRHMCAAKTRSVCSTWSCCSWKEMPSPAPGRAAVQKTRIRWQATYDSPPTVPSLMSVVFFCPVLVNDSSSFCCVAVAFEPLDFIGGGGGGWLLLILVLWVWSIVAHGCIQW